MTQTFEADVAAGPSLISTTVTRKAASEGGNEVASDDAANAAETAAASSAALGQVVAQNLKRLRRRQGYSLERLAKLSGVSRAMLGQIETGRSVPTIGLLARVAAALEVSIPSLLAAQGAVATQVLRPDKTRSLVASEGRFTARALFPLGGERRVEFYEVTIAPGHREQGEPHAAGTRENLVVVEGTVDVQVGREKPVALGAGDALLFAADQQHSYRNTGEGPARLYLVMIYPNGGA